MIRMNEINEITEVILTQIENGKYAEARRSIIGMESADIALLFEEIDRQNLLVMFRILPKEIAADVFSYMPNELQQYIIESSTDREIKLILEELFFDDTIDFIEEMPANVVKRILSNADNETRTLINQFLQYPETSAGSLMTIEYVDLEKEMTAAEALEHIRKTGIDKETIDTCYVLDNNRILAGSITIRKLILVPETTRIADIMDENVIYINTHDDREEVAALFKKYDYLVMPVVDSEHRLVGIVTIDHIVDVIELENTEDLQKMAAIAPSEKPYLKTNALTLAKHRIPWLLILMISATFTGNIIKKFQDALQSVMILAAFIPMLMDTGGNSGSQSSTLVIRGLALGEIKLRDFFRVLWKELQIGIIIGVTLSAANFLKLYFFDKTGLMIAFTVCITQFMTIIIAKIIGGTLPIIAKKLGVDPAIMASPLITTIVDAAALIIYFTTATKLLNL